MIKFTKEEISLCKQVAEKHRKKIKYGDWYLLCLSDGKTNICLNYSYAKNGRRKAYSQDVKFFKFCTPKVIEIIPLWTISDCLEFLRERGWLFELRNSREPKYGEYYCACYVPREHPNKKHGKYPYGKTPLEACLKVILAVLKGDKS